MAESKETGPESLTVENEKKGVAINTSIKIPRRKLTLIIITFLLNILHWSSIVCVSITIFQIASNPEDRTSIPSEILTLTSAFATILYTYFHTIISLKQRIWKHQQRHPSKLKKTTYFAIRAAVSLCVLWLLACGWNMIIVARRPVCLSKAPELQVWEFGLTCHAMRANMAFAMISLIASCTLFGILAVVRRPLEAHLYKHGYQTPSQSVTPPQSRETSPHQPTPQLPERLPFMARRPATTYRRASVSTLDLSYSPAPPTIHAPSPQRLVGFGILTSQFSPPRIPTAYLTPSRSSSLEAPPPVFQPSMSHQPLTRPPRMSGLVSTSGFIPLSIAPQYAASTWRAVHPASPSSLRATSRTHSNLTSSNISNRSRYSRSSTSLTRPRRLSTATPAGSISLSSRSESTGGEERGSPSSSDETGNRRASADEIAFALMNGTPIPGTTRPKAHRKSHIRTSSAPDTTCGAHEPLQPDRMAMGWKPDLAGQVREPEEPPSPRMLSIPIRLSKLVRSSSAELVSRFSPDSSPDDDDKTPGGELERNIDLRARVMKELPFERVNCIQPAVPSNALVEPEGSPVLSSYEPQELKIPKTRVLHSLAGNKKMTYDEVKNKPLPKIANL